MLDAPRSNNFREIDSFGRRNALRKRGEQVPRPVRVGIVTSLRKLRQTGESTVFGFGDIRSICECECPVTLSPQVTDGESGSVVGSLPQHLEMIEAGHYAFSLNQSNRAMSNFLASCLREVDSQSSGTSLRVPIPVFIAASNATSLRVCDLRRGEPRYLGGAHRRTATRMVGSPRFGFLPHVPARARRPQSLVH